MKLDAVESAAKNSPYRENIYHEFSESITNATATARFKGESNLHSKRAAPDIVCTVPANDRAAASLLLMVVRKCREEGEEAALLLLRELMTWSTKMATSPS